MSTIPTTEIIARPPANEILPPGHVWKTKTKPETTKPNPPRKHAPRTKLAEHFFS